jgi:hypothetical protein
MFRVISTHGNRQHGAENRQGYGHQHDQGVAEAVELRREHQEYQQQGQANRTGKLALSCTKRREVPV